jgi:hypothetical protein
MNKRLFSLAVAGSMLLGLACAASAGIPSDLTSTAASAGGFVLITPQGNGGSIADAGATITVTVWDAGSLPVANFPGQDIYLDDPGDFEIALCQGGSTADADTDALGVTTISGIISGGGHSLTTQVYISGTPLAQAALAVALVSPDITADAVVDGVDFGIFGTDFGTNVFQSDFTFDGIVDLTDFGIFGEAFGEVCP